jgi:hypothetical protein
MDPYLTNSEPGPVLVWPVEDAGIIAEAVCALAATGRVYFPAVTITGISETVSTSDQLRAVPITSMLTAANGRHRRWILERLAERSDTDGTAAELLAAEMPEAAEDLARVRNPTMRLRIPGGGKKPDKFYAQVAAAYRWLAENGSRRPALDIAERNGVAVTTVHRWIAEARRRGILEPGVRGRAGL